MFIDHDPDFFGEDQQKWTNRMFVYHMGMYNFKYIRKIEVFSVHVDRFHLATENAFRSHNINIQIIVLSAFYTNG